MSRLQQGISKLNSLSNQGSHSGLSRLSSPSFGGPSGNGKRRRKRGNRSIGSILPPAWDETLGTTQVPGQTDVEPARRWKLKRNEGRTGGATLAKPLETEATHFMGA